MTHLQRALVLSSLLFAAGAASGQPAEQQPEERPHPEKVFSCRTLTSYGLSGVITVQTFTRERAAEIVVGEDAPTVKGTIEKVVSVAGCVEKSAGERFSDPEFQRWVDSLAR